MRKLVLAIIISIAMANVCSAKEPSFQGLGDLAGGNFMSFAYDVSDGGTVVVGSSESESGNEAFRWTVTDGIEGLGL